MRQTTALFIFASFVVFASALVAVTTSDVPAGTSRYAAAYSDEDPVWSPGGRYLAYSRMVGKKGSVFLVAANGGALRRVVAGMHPSWSPDSSRIAFEDGTGSVSTVKQDGTGRRLVAKGGTFPRWSPDGGSIAFLKGGSLYVAPSVGGKARKVAQRCEAGMDWSPDGKTLVFYSPSGFGGQITFVGRDGKGLHNTGIGDAGWGLGGEFASPSWSPDGREIAFVAWEGEDAERLEVMRPDGRNLRSLADDAHGPKFSPDSKQIAVNGIRIVKGSGGQPRFVTHPRGGGWDENPVWSPDGKTLAFTRSGAKSKSRIWLVNSDGTHERQLTR